MDSEKREVHGRFPSIYSQKEETKVENLSDESDRGSYLESQHSEQPQLKRTLKARHLAVSYSLHICIYIYYYILKHTIR